MPPHYTRSGVRIDRAWNRATGGGVVIGITDTGVSYYQHHLTHLFASGHSAGRWYEHVSTIPGGGGSAPAWHDECGHGTRMSGAAVAPMNGANMAGVAWRSSLLGVRFTNSVVMPRTINTVQAISIAAAHTPVGEPSHHRRIVTMAWGSWAAYSPVSDEIRARYAQGTLFIGASGTTGWYGAWTGVIYPAWMDEVLAVSAVNLDYSRTSTVHYGSQVELSFFIDQVTTGFVTPDVSEIAGSSGATAVVSGIAALVWSRYPWMTRAQVRQRLREAGHIYPNRNSTVGFGVVNAHRAVGGMTFLNIAGPDQVAPQAPTQYHYSASHNGEGPFTYQWTNGATTSSTSVTLGPDDCEKVLSLEVTDLVEGVTTPASIHIRVLGGDGLPKDCSCDPTVQICDPMSAPVASW